MEIKIPATTERVISVICDACGEKMTPSQEKGKVYFDDDIAGWEEKDLCRRCYYIIIDTINVDIPKMLREDEV